MEIKKIYPLSPMQKGMLFHKLMDNNNAAYFEQTIFEIEGNIDIALFKKAYNLLIDKYDILRTMFDYKTFDQPMQIVKYKAEGKVYYKDLTDLSSNDKEIAIKNLIDKDRKKGFNLFKDLLMRVFILKLDDINYRLIWSNHHILMDGWCTSIIMKDLLKIYSSLKNNKEIVKNKVPTYESFINWIQKQDEKIASDYWENYIKEYEREAGLPIKSNTERSERNVKEKIRFNISKYDIQKLSEICNKSKVTMNTIFQCIWGIILQKYNNTNDVIFGSVLSGRNANVLGIEEMVGLFINTVPLRVKNSQNATFNQLIKRVQKEVLETSKFDYYPLYEIQSKSILKNKLINNIMVFENYYFKDLKSEIDDIDFVIKKVIVNEETNYNLDIIIVPGEIYTIELKYNSNLYDLYFIKKIESIFKNIIKKIINDVNIKIKDIDICDESEKRTIVYEFNNTKAEYPKNKTIQELFEEQVEKTSNNIAVAFKEEKLTYRELNEKANSLARVLRDKGVKGDSIIGIMVEKSLEMIIGIMGILKSGGAYLPIDPSYPKERIEYILKDSESKILLSKNTLVDAIEFDGQIIDPFNKGLFNEDSSNLEKINNSNNLAYVIYTSGTTGKPKGVMCEHKNVVRLVKNANYIEFKEDDRILQTGSMVFDASTFEVWGVLLNGLGLYLTKNETIILPELLEEFVTRNNITILWLTSELFNQIAEENINVFKNLRYLLTGGDILSSKYISLVRRQFTNLKIVNGYGPTENTTFSTTYLIEKEYSSNIPIGKPIANSTAYILNRNYKLNAIGIYGELFVGGDGVARGYLNRPELTAEKFIDNPFEPGTKMYKTGDLARWLPDGNIEFLGRTDNQVKIRGFRIELGEIENGLLQHENIKEAAVLVKENKDNEKYICAYVVRENSLEELDLKGYLRETLPEYMVPAYFVQLEKMPLTANGKLDRKALSQSSFDVALKEYEAPRNEVEDTLTKIWSEVLGINKIGINDNFFEIGGHSLKAMTIISKIHKETNKEIPLKELFKSPTIKGLSKFIESARETVYSNIEKIEEKECYEASSAQKRMYIIQEFDKESIVYNMPQIFEIQGSMDKAKIEDTFRKLVERHEALRTYFETVEDEIVQKIDNNYEFKLKEEILHKSIEEIANDFVKPFDLGKAPLFRAEIIKIEDKNYLLIDIHHIISDGVSMSILINEFATIYNGQDLKPLRLQYKDFAVWQNNLLKSDGIKKQEQYWVNRFKDEVPVLNLPYDHERPVIQSFEGEVVNFEADEKITQKLRKLTRETETTMHMVLLSAFYILLSKYSQQEDIVVGAPISGRPHADLENIMGMFVNTLALRNKPEGNKKYIDFLNEVKENSLKAYENQSYQLEALVEKLSVRGDTSRNPLFDVMFSMIETDTNINNRLGGLILKPYNEQSKVSKIDLTLDVLEEGRTLKFSMEYCSKLFNKETIERLCKHYISILGNITKNSEIKISEIDLLCENEKSQILYEFNKTKADYPKEETIQELFEEQVEKTPDNIAVVSENKQLTYRKLNERANSLARLLRDKGVSNDSIVGIQAEKSLEMIIAIMGILKAGGAYMPIDPSYPKERIEYMLRDSESKIILTTEDLIYSNELDIEVTNLFDEELFTGDPSNLEITNNSRNLAYILYTSGSTGDSKGVEIEHTGVINLISWFKKQYEIDENDRILQTTNYTFDVSVEEIFGTLSNGATLYLVDTKDLINNGFKEFIDKNSITMAQFVPSTLEILIANNEKLNSLDTLICGGEKLDNTLKNKVLAKGYNLFNHYGPTEITVDAITTKCHEDYTNIIGRPIQNTSIYILNSKNQLVPIGVPGEICIGGTGVARGYLNNTRLTLEKFIDNPFVAVAGTKIYKTGDLGRFLPDGNIEFLGRIDNQVKIRGFRIELGDIESKLLQHIDVKEAAVVLKEDKKKGKYLCAYIVSEDKLNESNLKSYLKESLPEYMIPSYFVSIDKMPITPNGKLDRRAFPKPNLDERLTSYEAPRNSLEEMLSKIWVEVLGVNKIGINDNFFELGGHSLKAMTLISKIHKETNKEVSLKGLFKEPTIKGLSKFIESSIENTYCSIEKVEEKEYYEASSAQKRMYIIQQFDKSSIAYNMPQFFEIEGIIDKNKIEDTFRKLVKRHEALRTYFETVEDEVVQKIDNNYEFRLK
ncbi:non-ribosomal peptide synthetase, partial [Clostridium frigidicarnis]